MSKNITILSGLLALQLVITGVLFFADSSMKSNNEIKPLVNLNNSELNQVKVIEGDKALTLSKVDDKWQLEGYPDLELQESKVRSLTKELATVKVSWPVTTTASSHDRFKVANDNFEKQVVFTDKAGNKQTLYLGKTPSFKQLYARALAQDDVFSIEYSAYQLSVDVDDWLDKSQLSVDNISKINHSVINLEKNEESWQLAAPSSLDEQSTINISFVEGFISNINKLYILGVADNSEVATSSLTIHDGEGNQYVYSFAANEASYFVQRNDIKQWFTLSKSTFDQLTNLSLEQFILTTEEKEEGKTKTLSE